MSDNKKRMQDAKEVLEILKKGRKTEAAVVLHNVANLDEEETDKLKTILSEVFEIDDDADDEKVCIDCADIASYYIG